MSKRYNSVKSEVTHVLHDVKGRSTEEIEAMFGIQLNDDGTVYDPTYHQYFKSIADWAWFSAEQDEMELSETFHAKGQYEDF